MSIVHTREIDVSNHDQTAYHHDELTIRYDGLYKADKKTVQKFLCHL